MCSHENVTWEVVPNTVADRMIDNSLIHKFMLSQKIERRTKILNAQIKKYHTIYDYKQYIKIKTIILRDIIDNTDTDDDENFTDVDYSVMYNSEQMLSKYITANSKCYTPIIDEEEEEIWKNMPNIELNKTKHMNVGWQEITAVKRNEYNNSTLNKSQKNIFQNKEYGYLKACLKKRSLDSDNNTVFHKAKHINKNRIQKHTNLSSIKDKLDSTSNSQDTAIYCKIDKNAIQRKSNIIVNESNSKSDAQGDTILFKTVHANESIIENNSNTMINEPNLELNSQDNEIFCKAGVIDDTVEKKNSNMMELNYDSNAQEYVLSNKTKSANKNTNLNAADRSNSKTDSQDIISTKITSVNENVTCNYKYSDKSNKAITNKSNPKLQENATLSKAELINKSPIQNQTNSNIIVTKPVSESDQDNTESCKIRSVKKKSIKRDLINKLNIPLNSQNLDCGASLSSSVILENISNPFVSINDKKSIFVEKANTEELIKASDKNSITVKNHDICEDRKSFTILKNIKRNLIPILDNIDSTNDNVENKKDENIKKDNLDCNVLFPPNDSSPNASPNQQKDSGIEEDSQDKYLNIESSSSTRDIAKKSLVSPQFKKLDKAAEEIKKICIKESNLESGDHTLKKQDDVETKESTKDSLFSSQSDDKNAKINNDKTHLVEREGSFDTSQKQSQLKVTSTEVVNMKYKILNEKINDINIKDESPIKINTLTSCSSVIYDGTNNQPEEVIMDIKQQEKASIWLKEMEDEEEKQKNMEKMMEKEEEEEEDEERNANDVSPQTKKRLEQQARLNLIVDNDSSDSEDESRYLITANVSKNYDISDTSHCSEDENKYMKSKNDKRSHFSETNGTNILCSEDIRENICIPENENLRNDTRNCAFGENNKDISYSKNTCEDIYENEKLINDKNHASEGSDMNISCNGNICERVNETLGNSETSHASEDDVFSSLNKENISDNQNQNTSVRYRPCNLQELVEDQKLLVETLPASFTLADYFSDEEAFILNIPDKILQCGLQGQQLIMKGETIKFGKSKYKVTHKKAGTITCIFATGKQRKPYKMVNIKEFSNITVGEKLSHHSRNLAESNCHTNTYKLKMKKRRIYSDSSNTSNQQIDEMKPKISDISNSNKRRRYDSSEARSKYPMTKKDD